MPLLLGCHEAAKANLMSTEPSEGDRLRLDLQGLSGVESKLSYLESMAEDIGRLLRNDELEKVLGSLFREIVVNERRDKLLDLEVLLNRLGYRGEIRRQLEGRILIELNHALNDLLPTVESIAGSPWAADELRGKCDVLIRLVADGSFISSNDGVLVSLKARLIMLRTAEGLFSEKDVEALFDGIPLPEAVYASR